MPELSIALDEGHRSRGERTLEHTILREGAWKHPKAPGGVLKIDSATLGELERNFNAGVGLAKDSIPFHVGHTEHLDDRAAAWARVKVTDDPERPGKKRMVSLANYTTDEDYAKVKSGQYAYVSPTIDFGYTDKESGSKFGAVLRNVALTNYPYIKQMGAARVVNLSEIAHDQGDEDTVRLAGGLGFDGTSAQGDPNPDGLPKGYDVQELPKQCLACARLGNDCPFAAPIAAADLGLKQAAAASGNCPQYVEADSNQPGGGGGADAQVASPAAGRATTGRAQMSDKTPNRQPNGKHMADVLRDIRENPKISGEALNHLHKGRMLAQGLDANDVSPILDALHRSGKVYASHTDAPGFPFPATDSTQFEPLDSPTKAQMSDRPAKGKTKKTRPAGASRGTTTMPLSEAQINKLMEQVNASRAEQHDAFLVSLAEDYKLPADTLKAVKKAFDDGASHSVALSEAIGDATVALSEAESDVDLETPASTVDLSDAVLLPRATLRELIGAVAGGGTGVKEGDTKVVPGKPRTKPAGTGTDATNAADPALVALSDELATMQPDEAVARMKEFENTGK